MNFKIDSEKLEQVTRMFNEQVDPAATEELIEKEISMGWDELDPRENQEWIDTADAQAIVDWLATFYA